MKKKRSINLNLIPGLIAAAALVLLILPAQALALVDCTTPGAGDFDGDGFTNLQECAGIALDLGAAPPVTFPVCASGLASNDPARALCVDPNSKDLFVILARATSSLIPSDPLKFISAPQLEGGLGFATHEITQDQAALGRRVTNGSNQLAARITESKDTNGTNLGASYQGMALDDAEVFTQRIANLVNSVCDATIPDTSCVDSNSATNGIIGRTAVIEHFIRHTSAHEGCGHPCDVASEYNARFGGNHYKAGTIVVMEQNVTYSKKGTKVTWYISSTYTDSDKTAANTLP